MAEATRTHNFDGKILQLTLTEIAQVLRDGATLNQGPRRYLEAGHGPRPIADWIMTQGEEARLREFRNRIATDTTQTTPCQPVLQADPLWATAQPRSQATVQPESDERKAAYIPKSPHRERG